MSLLKDFLRSVAHDVYWCEGNPDSPECPECGKKMKFTGGDLSYGEGHWDCNCGYSFTEEDLSAFDVENDY